MKGDLVMSKREFGLMDLYLTSNNYLDAEQVDERHYLIHLSNGKEIEVKCHFCNTAYTYSVEELKDLLKKAKR